MGRTQKKGNIYKGRIVAVEPNLQAAFVDIGLNQAAFIYVDDVTRDSYREIEKYFVENSDAENNFSEIDFSGITKRHHILIF